MENVAIVGYGETKVNRERAATKMIEQYFGEAVTLALESAGLTIRDFDGQGVGLLEPQNVIPIWSMQLLQDMGLRPRLVIRSDHGGAGAGALLEQAASAISSGMIDLALCVCADAPLTYLKSGATVPQRVANEFQKPFGMMGPNSLFAIVANRYIHQYGIRPEQVGKIAVVQRLHSSLNPNGYLRKTITLDDYLKSRMISDPIRLLDCCIGVNGGLAFVVASAKKAKDITDRPVYLLGSGACHNYDHGSTITPDITYLGTTVASREVFSKVKMRREDISFLQAYDDYSYAAIMQIEDTGFCQKGKAGAFLDETDISYRGELPMNTGGGQLSAGQPGMAGSFLPVVEAVRQLRGEGGERQVRNAKTGLVSLVGGIGQYGSSLVNTFVCLLGNEV